MTVIVNVIYLLKSGSHKQYLTTTNGRMETSGCSCIAGLHWAATSITTRHVKYPKCWKSKNCGGPGILFWRSLYCLMTGLRCLQTGIYCMGIRKSRMWGRLIPPTMWRSRWWRCLAVGMLRASLHALSVWEQNLKAGLERHQHPRVPRTEFVLFSAIL